MVFEPQLTSVVITGMLWLAVYAFFKTLGKGWIEQKSLVIISLGLAIMLMFLIGDTIQRLAGLS